MKNIIIFAIVVLIGAIGYAVVSKDESSSIAEERQVYISEEYGLTFEYPKNYVLDEINADTGNRVRRQLVLTEDTEWNRKLRSGEVADTEGPVSITVDIFQNNLDKMSALSFITGTNDSNYKLGPGDVATSTYGNLEGLEYSWSGLYEGRSFVVSNNEYVYMFSVTRLEPEDEIVNVFESMMETVDLTR